LEFVFIAKSICLEVNILFQCLWTSGASIDPVRTLVMRLRWALVGFSVFAGARSYKAATHRLRSI
jgi:hypothetical protein